MISGIAPTGIGEAIKRIVGPNIVQQIISAHRCSVLHRFRFSGRRLNFYFLSTGRVGTRFFAHVLDTATNAHVFHQPPPQLRKSAVQSAVSTYVRSIEQFTDLRLNSFPRLQQKVLWQMTVPTEIYGDTLNHMFPFGHLLYKHFGASRLRLIHLIRHPVTCGRSTLVAEKDWGNGERFSELRPKEFIQGEDVATKAANVWINVNSMIRKQFEMIGDPDVCRVVRLEDVSVDLIGELFDFLQLKGFDEARVHALMEDKSHGVRHSHVRYHADRTVSTDELAIIARATRSFAETYGYDCSKDKWAQMLSEE
jgi:hypothetical protein